MFNGRIFIEGNIVLNFLVEEGICTEDAECNLRGDIEILILFENSLNVALYKRAKLSGDCYCVRSVCYTQWLLVLLATQ